VATSGTPYEACYIGGIFGAEVSTGTALPVYVDTDGHLGTVLVNAKGTRSAAPLRRGKGVQPQARFNQKVEKLEATATEQQKQIAHQQKQISEQQRQIEVLMVQLKEQAAQIQKVSAQIEVSKAAPRTVLNNQ
jgi:septal ring factor EnvC (AmiA/AmiB activator)